MPVFPRGILAARGSSAAALALAQCRVMEETLGEAPIILLDDVLSELDKTRRDYFLHGEHPGQVFITCCDRGAAGHWARRRLPHERRAAVSARQTSQKRKEP